LTDLHLATPAAATATTAIGLEAAVHRPRLLQALEGSDLREGDLILGMCAKEMPHDKSVPYLEILPLKDVPINPTNNRKNLQTLA